MFKVKFMKYESDGDENKALSVEECHKINLNRGGSYIDSSDWIKNKMAAISPINKKYIKWFQYVVIVTLSYEEIKKDTQRITKIKPFMNKYYWKGINLPSKKVIGKNLRKIM